MTERAALPLDPQIAELLADPAISGPGADDPIALRADMAAGAAALAGPPIPVARAWDVRQPLWMRIFEPADAHGTVLLLHGGGWVLGSPETHDQVARRLAVSSGARVVLPDYRLAPEHPYPAAVEDAQTALAFARELAPGPVAVAGDSAGGNLAAVLARHHRDLALQALVYPVCDVATDTASYREFADGFGLTAAGMRRFVDLYGGDPADPDLAPLRAGDLVGVAPAAILLASHDVLRDEGEAYAQRLRDAGVAVALRVEPGTVHGFIRWPARAAVARTALEWVGERLREALARGG